MCKRVTTTYVNGEKYVMDSREARGDNSTLEGMSAPEIVNEKRSLDINSIGRPK
jgi:hypothetical protein